MSIFEIWAHNPENYQSKRKDKEEIRVEIDAQSFKKHDSS